MLGLDSEPVKQGKLYLKPSSHPILGLAAIVGLAGPVEGRVILDMSMETGVKITETLNFETYACHDITEENREIVASTLTEVANVVTGRAVTKLYDLGFKFDLTPPTLVVGSNTQISTFAQESLVVPLELPQGLVEINIAIRERISEGFEIAATAGDGEEAVRKYKELSHNLDFVTMDITMPKMDGITALEKIIEYDKEAKVIMVSALGSQDAVKKALMAGAKNYIVKPLDRKKVLERITSSLK
ncbi:UNVERIFIED_CONTAM: hypothetical protein PYX00_011917 [Menopon gallinae]|uniref:Response regulatory domain-containing protein n=1 Tax=Menopon gallinae TaxID=328185 RepID=A0AAW2H940_9NEOP